MASSADAETIHKAFRRLSKELHPDTTALPVEQAAEEFQHLCEAYELLTDPIRRKEYDHSLSQLHFEEQASGHKSRSRPSGQKVLGGLRPLSGGELFSLLLLGTTLIFSLVLAFFIAFMQGREWQVKPSWLTDDQMSIASKQFLVCDVVFAPFRYSTQ